MDLNSLPRTLAERIWNEAAIIDGGGCTIFQFEKAEALIREAIEKTLEAAIAVCDRHFEGCGDRPNCHLLDISEIYALKPATAGRAEQSLVREK